MTAAKKKTVWETLCDTDVSEHAEEKDMGNFKLTYLSWAWAWHYLKTKYPTAKFKKHTFEISSDGATYSLPYMIDKTGYSYVMVTVTVEDEEVTEVFPVLNHSNKPIQKPNSYDVNTAHQRCLTKCLGYLGLGISIYAGEDLNDPGTRTEEVSLDDEEESPPPDDSGFDDVSDFIESTEEAFDGFKSAALKIGDVKVECSTDGNLTVPQPCIDFDPSVVEQWVEFWVDKFLAKSKTKADLNDFYGKNKNIFSAKGLLAKSNPDFVLGLKDKLTARVEELS
jgi:disulfide oxidoreductase YuzD